MADFLNKYSPIKILAEGSYGKVLLARRLGLYEGELVAVKMFNF